MEQLEKVNFMSDIAFRIERAGKDVYKRDVSPGFAVSGPKPVACHRAVHGSWFIFIGYQPTLYRIFYSSTVSEPVFSV